MICKFPVNLLVRFQEGFWVCFKFELGSGSFEEKLISKLQEVLCLKVS